MTEPALGIPLEKRPCQKCGGLFPFTIPFVMNGFRGYQQEAHECGEEFRQSIFVSGDKEWNRKIAARGFHD